MAFWDNPKLHAYNVFDYGAKSYTGLGDSSPNIRRAISAAVNNGGGAIYFPSLRPGGYYLLDKDSGAPASINLENVTVPLVFYTDGGIAKLVFGGQGNGGAWSMWRLRGSQNIKFFGLDMEMGTIVNQDPDQGADPHHLIHLDNSGSPARDITNVEIASCIFHYTRGDHVRLWSEAGRYTSNVSIHHNWMFGDPTLGPNTTPGCRSCVQVQRNCKNVWITDNYMTRCHKAEIDFEPTGTGPVSGFFVERNIVDHNPVDTTQGASAVALSGNGPTEPNSYSTFKGNLVIAGGLQMEQLDRCVISDNIILDSRRHANPSIHLNGRNSFIRVERNYVHRYATNPLVQPVVLIQHGGGTTDVPSDIRVEDNDFVQEQYSSVAYMEGVVGVTNVKNNRFYYNGTNYDGITNIFHLLVETDGKTPAAEPIITENWAGGSGLTRSCVQLNANTGDMGDAVVNNNTLRQAGTGIELNRGASFVIPSLVMMGNANYCTTKWSKPGLMTLFPIIGGNKGGVCTFETSATPEGAITAPVGCTAINTAGGASTTLYVKTSGTGNTGWTAK